MQPFATGKYAFGYCDYCDQRRDLHELKRFIFNLIDTGLLLCPECWTPDQPQLQVGRYPIDDPQALRNPRPNDNLAVSRGLFGWTPTLTGQEAQANLGQVYFLIPNP